MTSYQKLKEKPNRFLALTGYTVEEFLALLPPFFHEIFGVCSNKDSQRKNAEKNARIAPTKIVRCRGIEDKLFFILIHLRKAMTQDVLGELFGMAQPVANKWIHLLLPVLNETLANLGELQSRKTKPEPVDENAPLSRSE